MKLTTATMIAVLAATGAFAGEGHGDQHSHMDHSEADHKDVDSAADHDHTQGHKHGDHAEMMDVGIPGSADDVVRTIEVIMRETDDGDMIFEPGAFDFTEGETIRFNVVNKGEIEHEFVIDTVAGNAKHKDLMAQMDMEHDDPNSVSLDPGRSDEIIWTFANAGSFEFACLIPGHYESGMHGPIEVAQAETDRLYTKGVVKKVKPSAGKVTIIHEDLVELGMPGMTMVFRADDEIISMLSEGQEIEFLADRVDGKLKVTGLK